MAETAFDKLTKIADNIRLYTYTDSKLYSLDDMAIGVEDAYRTGEDSGFSGGFWAGYDEGYAEAKIKVTEPYAFELSTALNSGETIPIGIDEAVDTAIADITAIKTVIENHGVEVPVGTLSSTYDETIEQIIVNTAEERYMEGVASGWEGGIEQGKLAAVDEFWDEYQQNGNRRNYANAFEGAFWTDERFKPQYEMAVVDNANYMFRTTGIKDLSKLNITSCQGAWAMCREASDLTTFGNLSVAHGDNYSFGANLSQAFYGCGNLTKIGVLTVATGTMFDSTFTQCKKLTEVTFKGIISTNLNIGSSPLNKASIESIIKCLSATVTGKTLTLNKSAVNAAFGIDVDDETTFPEGSEYYILRHSRDNWNFSYSN